MSDDIKKGLAGVIVDETAISKVNPDTNSLIYRGYAVQDLCARCSFEEVAYLMWNGELPDRSQLDAFIAEERGQRGLSDALMQVIRLFPKNAHPMDTVRTGVSFLGMEDKDTWNNDPADNYRKSVAILAKTPTIVAADYRIRKGMEPIAPRDDLTFAENFFNMCFGEVPAPEIVKAFDVSLILYAEHSFNASTFTGRVIASTLSDIYGAVVGAIAALKGPLHGGANEAVMHTLLEIGEPERAQAWIDDAIDNRKLVMGFGHRVYKSGDSRVPTMTKAYHDVARLTGGEKWVEISRVLEKTFIDRKNIYPNLDFPTGPAYYLMGFDIDLFTPIFVMSRITGWTAHVIEQLADNKLIRPLSAYNGVDQREVPAIGDR